MSGFNNKRNFYRMMLNTEVAITILDDEINSKSLATCRDMSATGMAVEMNYPLEIGSNVRIKVESSNQGVHALDAKGRVVRVDEENKECYLIGILIDEIE